jgi:hypothetical protein
MKVLVSAGRYRTSKTWILLLGVVLVACGGQSMTRPNGDEPSPADSSENAPTEQAPDVGTGSASEDDAQAPAQGSGGGGGSPVVSGNEPGSPVGEGGAGSPVGEGGADSAAGGAGAEGPDAGVDPWTPDPDNDDSTVLSLSGPLAEYALASFFVNSDAGWVLEEAVETDAVELEVQSRTLAAGALAEDSGNVVDLGVASCDAFTTDPVVRRVPADYPTIQAAIDATNPGDTVLVAPGTYSEQLRLRSHVKLIGSGASTTVLDGGNEAVNLIDFTGARSAVVSGFTLTNVQADGGCSADDPWGCSGNWYRAAVYGDGSSEGDPICGDVSSLLFTRNVVTGNEIGFLLYFHARAIVTNNVFVSNRHAFVANHHQDHSLVANNVFYDNDELAVAASASHLSVLNNVFVANGTAFAQEYIQRGWVGCNVAFGNGELGDGFSEGGFVDLDPLFVGASEGAFELDAESPARGVGCLGKEHEPATDAGAFGGPLGSWSP